MNKKYICTICKKEFTGYGNNAEPITSGVCCNNCNATVVIPTRLQHRQQQTTTDPFIKQMAEAVMSDKEFSQALHDVVSFVQGYFDKEQSKGMPAALHVFTRHRFGDSPERIVILLENFPPPIGALISRYELMRIAGAKYFEEFVKAKPSGKKCYPLAVFINSEAWARMEEKKENIKSFEEAKASIKHRDFLTAEDKQEVLISAGMTLDNRNNLALSKINRLQDDTIMLSGTKFMEYKKESTSGSDLLINFYRGFVEAMQKDGGTII